MFFTCLLHLLTDDTSGEIIWDNVQMFLLRLFFKLYRDCQSLHAMSQRLVTVSSLLQLTLGTSLTHCPLEVRGGLPPQLITATIFLTWEQHLPGSLHMDLDSWVCTLFGGKLFFGCHIASTSSVGLQHCFLCQKSVITFRTLDPVYLLRSFSVHLLKAGIHCS